MKAKDNHDGHKHNPATADDVALVAGVSKWTVLRAFQEGASISDKSRKQVMAAAQQLGFQPNLLARSLKRRKTNIIGVVADEFTNPHSLRMLREVTAQLNERGYMTLLLNVESAENFKSVLQMAGQLQVDGLIYLATIVSDALLVATETLHHIPAIHVFRSTDSAEIDEVMTDGFNASRQLGQLLTGQGYQRYGYLKGPDTSSRHLLRLEGYTASLHEAGKTLDQLLVAGNYDRDRAYEIMRGYLLATPAEQRIEALFCENDVLAFGAMQAVKDFSPDLHIGMVGFDNVDEAHSPTWSLTSWDQDAALQISEAISRLIDGNTDESMRRLPGKLALRTSHLRK
ncbi:LacI family DNA-binding transcriptional regulator [Tatumella citrea]|uniref:LacI family transcriptional regulator n=1 Tax=Tatumella citrea TaxID=53336 RepID=A0A1Y0L992_TATCI|nr:LacI family DNA-binding transcriptional regulator [Tatumella citrea]ARU94335.1 LacI family transcriptional regulator [Tatumella citrea]ARU98375.1 LacI family transcriptional regulator [Tatumella citrea]